MCHHLHLQVCNLAYLSCPCTSRGTRHQSDVTVHFRMSNASILPLHFTKPVLKLDSINWVENGYPSSSEPWNGLCSVPSHFTANFMWWNERCKYVWGFMHEPRFMTAVQDPHRSLNTSALIHHVINPWNYSLPLSHSAAIRCMRGARGSSLQPALYCIFTFSHLPTPK